MPALVYKGLLLQMLHTGYMKPQRTQTEQRHQTAETERRDAKALTALAESKWRKVEKKRAGMTLYQQFSIQQHLGLSLKDFAAVDDFHRRAATQTLKTHKWNHFTRVHGSYGFKLFAATVTVYLSISCQCIFFVISSYHYQITHCILDGTWWMPFR